VLANQNTEIVAYIIILLHAILTGIFLLFLFRFLQQPSEGTTISGTGDGEGTETVKRKEKHVLKTNGKF